VKFTPEGGRVTARAFVDESRAVLEVEDTGIGIPPAEQGRLFQRFFRSSRAIENAVQGTGLGLAITKAIVELHGGEIGVANGPERGAIFWFEVPTAITSSPPLAGCAPGRVLLVEDDDALAQMLLLVLRADGIEADHASSIEEAEARLAHGRPAAMILDIHLPDGCGLDLLARLRAQAATQDVPVVVLSGRDPEHGTIGGPLLIDWIRKPFDEERLREALRRALALEASPKVLLVDDDRSLRAVLGARLRSMGLECVEAADGAEAVRAARHRSFDLIILDVGMPRPDGFEVVDILRRESAGATPLIVYSGRDLTAEDRRSLTLGVTHYLTKARSTEADFVRSVRELLRGVILEPEAWR
jgi:DNA-binding response OmpR family regulator